MCTNLVQISFKGRLSEISRMQGNWTKAEKYLFKVQDRIFYKVCIFAMWLSEKCYFMKVYFFIVAARMKKENSGYFKYDTFQCCHFCG